MSKCPTCGQEMPDDVQMPDELRELEERIFALNRQIRRLLGVEPTPEWRALVQRKDRLVREYHARGGTKFGPPHSTGRRRGRPRSQCR